MPHSKKHGTYFFEFQGSGTGNNYASNLFRTENRPLSLFSSAATFIASKNVLNGGTRGRFVIRHTRLYIHYLLFVAKVSKDFLIVQYFRKPPDNSEHQVL